MSIHILSLWGLEDQEQGASGFDFWTDWLPCSRMAPSCSTFTSYTCEECSLGMFQASILTI